MRTARRFGRMRNRVSLSFALILVLVSGCAEAERGQGEGPVAETTNGDSVGTPKDSVGSLRLVVGSLDMTTMMPLLALELGYFEEEGIEASLSQGAAGPDAIAALAGGSADVASVALSHVVAARGEGLEVVAVTPNIEQYTLGLVVGNDVMEDLGISQDSSIEEVMQGLASINATIGISSPGAGTDIFLRVLCEEGGIDCDKDIEILALGDGSSNLAAFDERSIEGFVRGSPEIDVAALESDGTIIISGTRGDVASLAGFLFNVTIMTEDFLANNRDLAAAYVRAITKAMRAIDENPDQAKSIAKDAFGEDIPDGAFDSLWQENLAAISKDPIIDADAVATTYRALEQTQGPIGVPPEETYVTDLSEEAWSQLEDWQP